MEYTETHLKELLVIAAAGFFLWKVLAGWLVVNVQISIEAERQVGPNKQDWLAFKILLKKGNIDTLQIKDIQARVKYEENSLPVTKEFQFDEIHKLIAKEDNVVWGELHTSKNISLSPGESFHLGRYLEVPTGVPVIIEAVLHGDRALWWKGFQWRVSTV